MLSAIAASVAVLAVRLLVCDMLARILNFLHDPPNTCELRDCCRCCRRQLQQQSKGMFLPMERWPVKRDWNMELWMATMNCDNVEFFVARGCW